MLTKCQENAVDIFTAFLLDPLQHEMRIEGHAGTGKTYLTKHLCDVANSLTSVLQMLTGKDEKLQMYFTATTNKATEILSTSLGMKTSTIHSLLGLIVRDDYTNGVSKLSKTTNYQIFENSIIFIDESSMVDTYLLQMIQESTKNCKVVYILDPYQLAPVFELSAPVSALPISVASLVTQCRSPGPIALLGEQFRSTVKTGTFSPIQTNGNEILYVSGPTFQRMVNTEFTKRTSDLKLLAWTNKKVQGYNSYIRGLFTSSPHYEVGELLVTNKPILNNKVQCFSTEDVVKVTNVSNLEKQHGIAGYTYTLNGSIRVFGANDPSEVTALLKLHKRNGNWIEFYAMRDYFADLRPLYASTVYKAQGSTHKKTFIDLSDIGKCNNANTVARMLYVSATRAKEQVIFCGTLPDKYV
jgi:hypothetical protein